MELQAAARAIREFLAFIEALDEDADGNRVCPEERPTLEAKWGAVCEACNVVRRQLVLRIPQGKNSWVNWSAMPKDDRELFDLLSQVMSPQSAITRYTPDGKPWLEALAHSIEVPPVGRRVVEADRIRKLRAIADMIETKFQGGAVVAMNASERITTASQINSAYPAATRCLSAATSLAIVCESAAASCVAKESQPGFLADAAKLYAALMVAIRFAEGHLWPVLTKIRVALGSARGPLYKFGEVEETTAIETAVVGSRALITRTAFAAFAPHFKADHPYHRVDLPFPAKLDKQVLRALKKHWESSVLPAWREIAGVSKQLKKLKTRLDQEADEAHAKFVEPLRQGRAAREGAAPSNDNVTGKNTSPVLATAQTVATEGVNFEDRARTETTPRVSGGVGFGPRRGSPLTAKERDSRDQTVRDYIGAQRAKGIPLERITRDGVAAAVGLPGGAVSMTKTWEAVAEEKRQAKLKERPSGAGSAIDQAIESGDWDKVEADQERIQARPDADD